MPQRVMALGGAVLDVTFIVDRWPIKGGVADVKDFTMLAGGKGVNQAVALKRLDCAVDFVSCVGGDDAAERIWAALRANDISTQHVYTNPNAPTNVVGVLIHDGEPGFMGRPGASRTLTVAQLQPAIQQLSADDVALINYEVPPHVVNAALIGATDRGATTVVNPAPLHGDIPDPEPPYGAIDVFIPNLYEARILLRDESLSPQDAVRGFLAKGVGAVILTLGEDGSLYATDPNDIRQQPALPTTIVDTTGASDAFCAMVAARWRQLDLPAIMQLAAAAGAVACQTLGALDSMPTTAEIDTYLARTKH